MRDPPPRRRAPRGGGLTDFSQARGEIAPRLFGEVTVPTGSAIGAIDLLVAAGLAASKGAARRTIAEGGASVNNVRISDDTQTFTLEDTIAGGWLVVRRGRRAVAGVRLDAG